MSNFNVKQQFPIPWLVTNLNQIMQPDELSKHKHLKAKKQDYA